MGGQSSSHDWHPPPQPQANTASGSPVDYQMVARQVALNVTTDCGCFPKVHMIMDCDELYSMLGEQFSKGYRLVYFTRRPGEYSLTWGRALNVFFTAFFRMNPNLGERLEFPVTWTMRVDRSWLQSTVKDVGGFLSLDQRRDVNYSHLVHSISRNTQNGERLAAATVTGHSEPQTYSEFSSGLGPHLAIDLLFEVPSPPPAERYTYNIALIPAHVEYIFQGPLFFPEIQCDWLAVLQQHLSQGWRLIDIYVDVPITEQAMTPVKQRRRLCRPTNTNALWIFERPASMANNPRPLYEGTVMEQPVQVKGVRMGTQSSTDWMPMIQDMGMRGWELSCVVESHKVEPASWTYTSITIKSLLFFQRPIRQD